MDVSLCVQWWIQQRRRKLKSLQHETHAVNPFLWPVTFAMHGFTSIEELAEFQLAGHLVEGHATGFGKLVDEKILPQVFGTTKLSKAFRGSHAPYQLSQYDNIDHIIPRPSGSDDLLSLKAGRWSIQLGQAVQINRSLQVILQDRSNQLVQFDRIVIGVFYGTASTLTDKYAIIQGADKGATHDVSDISASVDVYAGRRFWSWLNGDEDATQEWVLEGISLGIEADRRTNGDLAALYRAFIADYSAKYEVYRRDMDMSWADLLRDVNG